MIDRPRVAYWNNIPAPYIVDRFNAVSRRDNLDFEAWFSARSETGRTWAIDESVWNFRYEYLPRVDLAGAHIVLPLGLFRRQRVDLLVSLYAGTSYILGSIIARRRGVATAFWVEVTFDSWVERRPWKEEIKRRILPAADGVLTVGQDGKRFAEAYGVSAERIHFARHGIDVGHFTAGVRRWYPTRTEVRTALGVSGTVFLYVGRLWRGKGIDYLLDAFHRVQTTTPAPTSLLLVGDGPDEHEYRERCAQLRLSNVAFAGFVQQSELPRLYAASDVFIFPTIGDPYGLVIDEAMASGLPVIATTATGEVAERVVQDVNGWLVPPRDAQALADRMGELAADSAKRKRFGDASTALIGPHTPDKWASDFETSVHRILSDKLVRRRMDHRV